MTTTDMTQEELQAIEKRTNELWIRDDGNDAQQDCRKLISSLRSLQEQTRWRDVTKEQPKENTHTPIVVVNMVTSELRWMDTYTGVYLGEYDYGEHEIETPASNKQRFTHWLPLPPLPPDNQ